MFFSKEDKTVITTLQEPSFAADSAFLSSINSMCSFSNFTCCACLCLVPIFGAAGLGLGFALAISNAFSEYVKTHWSELEGMLAFLPPFIGLFAGICFAFFIWGKLVDWAMDWEVGAARRRGPGLIAACQDFFSCGNQNVALPTNTNGLIEPLESSEESDETEHVVIHFS